MNVLECISNVPDTTTKITFTANYSQFNAIGCLSSLYYSFNNNLLDNSDKKFPNSLLLYGL